MTREVLEAAQKGAPPPIDQILEKRFQAVGQLTDAEKRKAFLKWLEGVWLDATQKPTRAAADYYEAGRSYSGQENYEGAEKLLTRANHLDPSHVPTYWDLAEACLMRSYHAEADDAEGLLSRSIATWQSGAALTLPDSSTSWAYVSRAFMSERLAQLHPEGCEELWWEAAVYLERAILLNDQNAVRWAALGRYHRCLDNEFSAVQTTSDALERDPRNSSALEERVAILANIGEFDLAEQALAELQSQPSWNENTWAQGVRAYLLAHRRQYVEAAQAISDVIQREGETIWNLDLQALCLRMVGERASAAQVDGNIWTIYEASDNPADDDKSTSGSAAYRLGKLNDAVEIFETLMDNHLQAANAYRSVGLCYLAAGDARGEEYLLRGIERATSQSELDDFVIIELSECERSQGSWVHRGTGTAILERVKAKVQSRRGALEKPSAADKNATAKAALGELERVVASCGRGQNEGWTWIGAQAGLARLHSQGERWREAATVYQDLLQADGRFPEAKLGIEKAIESIRAEAVRRSKDKKFADAAGCLEDALAFASKLSSTGQPVLELHRELGEALWNAGQNREALNQFEQALALASDAGAEQACADFRVAIGVVQQELEDDRAPASVVASLKLYAESGVQDAGEALASSCRPLMRSAKHFWKIDSLLKVLGDEAAMETTSRITIAKARDSLRRYLDELFGLASADLVDDSLESFPIVTPIVLEVGARLVPKVDSKSDGGRFLSDLDAMRKRFQGRMGASLPGVRMRGNVSLAENSYVIMLDEVPIARGSVHIDMVYCPASAQALSAAGISLEDLVEAEDPSTGKTGCWVSAEHREAIESTRIAEWCNDTGFMLSHLEEVFHQNLSWCLGLQEVVELLTNESKRATGAASIETILVDVPSRLRCARVLRALVREGVPITELKGILEAMQDRGLSNIPETVRAVGLKLRRHLPRNDTALQQIEIPEQWEGRQTQQEGTIVFTASPFVALQLLSQVRKWMESRDRNAVLITRSAVLRPFLRRLVECEFPYVAVLSQDEILRSDALPSV